MAAKKDDVYFIGAVCVLAAIMLAYALGVTYMGMAWDKYDTDRFYQMADVILHGGTPYVDFQDPKPPLVFFALVLPSMLGQKLLAGSVLVGLFNLASAVLVMKIAWSLYGRASGLLAGFVFALNLAWVEGIFILTEPFTLTFVLLSSYVLLCWRSEYKYLAAGICAGIAIGFKQYALLAIPLSMLLLFIKGELRGAIGFLGGVALPLLAVFALIFVVYGASACQSALYWSFGVAGDYVTSDDVGGVPAWKPIGAFATASNIVYVTIAIVPLLVFSLASFARGPRPASGWFFFISGLAYFSTILIRPYFHYLLLALPFVALLCASAFSDKKETGGESGRFK